MTSEDWRKPCAVGCTCGKHKERTQPHPDNCQCAAHGGRSEHVEKLKKPRKRCAPGCTCKRHQAPHNRYTDEERAIANEEYKARQREYSKSRRARMDPALMAQEREKYKKHGRKYHLKSTMGITIEQWNDMLVEQSGRCYLCSEPLTPDITIDHDHQCCARRGSCGRCIRGLACRQCNQGLGQFKDDPERMRRAADALEAANARVRMR